MRDLPAVRRLIVNADDFGLSPGVNEGVARAHDRGVVTSASLMVGGPAVDDAVALAASRPGLSVGLHVDLGEWVHDSGGWVQRREVVPPEDGRAVRSEVDRQVERFHELLGVPPTHIDSHQHVHLAGPARGALEDVGLRLDIPVRGLSTRVRHCGDFYGQSGIGEPLAGVLTLEGLLRIVRGLTADITELGCHPGLGDDHGSVYATERALELDVLTDPALPGILRTEGVALISFAELGGAAVPARC